MAFDPVMRSMSQPVVVNLAEYGAGSENIANAILALVSTGGGTKLVTGTGRFWYDVCTDRPLHLILPYTGSLYFQISPVVFRSAMTANQVAFEGTMNYEGTIIKFGVTLVRAEISDTQSQTTVVVSMR